MSKEPKQTTALITADNERIKYALTHPEALTELLAPMKAKVDEKGRTVETKKGRDEIRSLAYLIAQSKTTIVKVGKAEVVAIKAEIKKYDTCIKSAEKIVEGYQHDVREPLTVWELLRAKANEAIDSMEELGYEPGDGVREIQAAIKRLEAVEIGNYPEEMQDRATEVRAIALGRANTKLGLVQKENEEQRELKQLRQDKIDSDAKEEKLRIATTAATKATKKANDKAAQDIIDANLRTEQAKQEKLDIIAEAKENTRLAEAKRINDIAQAEIRLEQKVENERLQKLAEEQLQQEERDKRTRNATHRADVQLEAMRTLMTAIPHMLEADAIAIIRAITDGKINHVTINF